MPRHAGTLRRAQAPKAATNRPQVAGIMRAAERDRRVTRRANAVRDRTNIPQASITQDGR